MPVQAQGTVSGIQNHAASHRVAAYLRTAILSGEIGPGERIRQEDVAERLGASRLPVREALRILEAEGLTEHLPNKGARVPSLSMQDLNVIYKIRERLEPLALTESIPNLSGRDLRELDRLQGRIEADTGISEFLTLDREFHLMTYTGCQVDQLSMMVVRLWNSTQHYRRAFMKVSGSSRRWVINAEHRLLLDAMERRDSVDAERHLAGHIRRTRIELSRHPEVFEGPIE
ncbi:GntR family transcriptional regulator [Planotetraspora phitsanulokensis]|uniref:GntR family transcriptional regulator n=1 Tax=Planotetraspora phitsanulokensis TaxID=575192 RepID=A0A8J3U5M8_9ACTN|nr:GntR family transcriptional regulator [Planotetraspora phitsanulokensis]GII37591.1 GntR family transcriptional regulator [Planotetraspora phitsanulokensis]